MEQLSETWRKKIAGLNEMLPKIVHASYCWLQTGCDWMSGMKNEPYISFQWHGLPIDRVLWLV